jgi:hypothetical protein
MSNQFILTLGYVVIYFCSPRIPLTRGRYWRRNLYSKGVELHGFARHSSTKSRKVGWHRYEKSPLQIN